jgi:hypothetical protein
MSSRYASCTNRSRIALATYRYLSLIHITIIWNFEIVPESNVSVSNELQGSWKCVVFYRGALKSSPQICAPH